MAVSDEVVTKYQELKLGHQHRFIFFKLTDDLKEVVFEKASPPGAKYDEFVAALPAADCRYAVYDFEYKAEDGGDRGKIVFVLWYVLPSSTMFSLFPHSHYPIAILLHHILADQ